MVYCCIMSRNVFYHVQMPYDDFFLFSFLFSSFVSLNMRIFKQRYFSASSYVIVIVNSFMFVRPILFKFSRYKSWVFRSCKLVLIPGVVAHISCKQFAACAFCYNSINLDPSNICETRHSSIQTIKLPCSITETTGLRGKVKVFNYLLVDISVLFSITGSKIPLVFAKSYFVFGRMARMSSQKSTFWCPARRKHPR